MAEDREGNLWMGTSTAGIYVYGATQAKGSARTRSEFQRENGLPGDWVNMLLIDSKGRLWAALRGGLAMIGSANGPGAEKWNVEQVYSHDSALVGTDVMALHEGSDGSLWVGTGMGISRLTWGTAKCRRSRNLTPRSGLERPAGPGAGRGSSRQYLGGNGRGGRHADRPRGVHNHIAKRMASPRIASFRCSKTRSGKLLAVTAGAAVKPTHSVDVFDRRSFPQCIPGGIFGRSILGLGPDPAAKPYRGMVGRNQKRALPVWPSEARGSEPS